MTYNVYADLGFENPEEQILKAELVVQIKRILAERKLSQVMAAKITGITQPRLSSLLRGHFQDVSVQKLLEAINALQYDIEIVLRPHAIGSGDSKSRVSVVML